MTSGELRKPLTSALGWRSGESVRNVPPGDAAPGPTAPSVVNGRPVTGVFVSSSIGRADGTGTLDSPLRTLKAAIARSREIGEPVVACAEHFAEPLEIVAGVSVIGNFDCTTPSWTQGTKRAALDSPTSPALIVTRVNSKTRLEGFEVRAPDFGANEPGAEAVSSIALLARDSSSFEVVDMLLHAGTGEPLRAEVPYGYVSGTSCGRSRVRMHGGHGHLEGASLADHGMDNDLCLQTVHDLTHERQSEAHAR